MPETARQILKGRAASHSDVADTPAARAHQSSLAERQLADLLLRRLRETKGELRLRNFEEEWHATDDGSIFEISVEAETVAE